MKKKIKQPDLENTGSLVVSEKKNSNNQIYKESWRFNLERDLVVITVNHVSDL